MVKAKPGYKLVKSLFGKYEEISEEWINTNLGNTLDLLKDGTHNPPPRISKGIPLLSSKDIHDGIVDFVNDVSFISETDYDEMQKKYKIIKNDVLLTVVGTLGRTALVQSNQKFSVQRSVGILRSNKQLDSHYLYYFIQTNLFQKQMEIRKNATAQPGVYLGELSKFLIYFPDNISEQQKIALILTNTDELIQSHNKAIELTKKLKIGLMQQLLSRGIGHKKFKKVKWFYGKELEIPNEWEVCTLEKCVKKLITYGIVQAGPHIENGIPYVRTSDMSGNKLSSKGMLRTSSKIASEYERSTISVGELVFAIRATVGKVLEVPEELDGANLTQGTARISPKTNFDNHFMLFALLSQNIKKQITSVIKGITFLEITLKNLRKIKILVPKFNEQQKIASILSGVDEKIDDLELKKTKLENLKKGLMQKLLTGQIRVKV